MKEAKFVHYNAATVLQINQQTMANRSMATASILSLITENSLKPNGLITEMRYDNVPVASPLCTLALGVLYYCLSNVLKMYCDPQVYGMMNCCSSCIVTGHRIASSLDMFRQTDRQNLY